MKAMWCVVLLLVPALALAGNQEKSSPIGKKIDNFKLRDYRGAERALEDFSDRKLVVVAFLGTECPLAKLYGPRLADLAKEFEPKGVALLGIVSNQQDSISAIAAYAKGAKLDIPILKDPTNAVADQFGAVRTPEVFVLDQQRVVRYWGRIDDQYGIGFTRPKATERDLATAVDELLAGKTVSKPVTQAPGCFIGRMQKEPKGGEITYSKHIAPILQSHCVECHHVGEIGPFSLTSYDETIGWTDTIAEVIRNGRMPPWHADPHYGKFANDAHLSDADRKLILDWIDNGAPEGDRKDLPKPVEFVEGWRIPKPDLVLPIPREFKVPATGDVPYEFIIIDPGFKEDKWVRAAEVVPGCRAVVHHVLVFVQPPGGGVDKYGGFAANWLVGNVPGARPMNLPDGLAKRIPAGSRLLLQIHYTTNGRPQTDQTRIGLVFADPKTVKKEVSAEMAANPKLRIPANADDHPEEADAVVPEDSLLLTMTPHTHLRGKAFKYEAFYPDGKHEILLDVPHYDFNWQNTYVLAEPKLLPKGTRLHCLALYNNSKSNPSNPNPNSEVRWGDQTWEEMLIGYFDLVPVEQDLRKQPIAPVKSAHKEGAALDAHLKELAAHAMESKDAFNAFAAALHKAMPKVDRVCVTCYSGGNLHVEQACFCGDVKSNFAPAGFEHEGKVMALSHFALIGSFQYLPDLKKARGGDMMMIRKVLASSAHVPVALAGGKPGTVNFWSKETNAFPEETHDQLRALAETVVGQKQ
jgi:peroxiredoxin